jgi:proline utilization trans-activator
MHQSKAVKATNNKEEKHQMNNGNQQIALAQEKHAKAHREADKILKMPTSSTPCWSLPNSCHHQVEGLVSFSYVPQNMSLTFIPVYLGTSSNWSFHGQVLNLVHQHIRKSPLPGADLLFDGSAYDLPWDGSRNLPDSNTPIIPSTDYAIFLINAVKFHCAQLVHLFDEDEFMANLHAFYSNSEKGAWRESLWYIHFLLIIAFGKTFVQHKHHAPRPPGADFFVHAIQLLPDTNRLCREPVTAVEILCCISLYLQALDSRNAAHVTIGQAMRIALAQGMHTDMPVADLGEPLVQRCRKIWWTVYILDRQMTSLMGLPQNIRDEDITCRLPSFAGSAQRAAALDTQVKLARIYADISRSMLMILFACLPIANV